MAEVISNHLPVISVQNYWTNKFRNKNHKKQNNFFVIFIKLLSYNKKLKNITIIK